MADVRLVYVEEDATLADRLADAFEDAGFVVDSEPADAPLDNVSAGLLFWTHAAIRTPAFRSAAQATIDAGKAVIANLSGAPIPPVVKASPVFDLKGWSGDPEDPRLDDLSSAVERLASGSETVSAAQARAAPAHAPIAAHDDEEDEPDSSREEPYIAPEPQKLSAASDDSHRNIRVIMPRSRGRGALLAVVGLVALGGAAFGGMMTLRQMAWTTPPATHGSTATVSLSNATTRPANVVEPPPPAADTLPTSLPVGLDTTTNIATPAAAATTPPAPPITTTPAPSVTTTATTTRPHAPITYVTPPAHRAPAHTPPRRSRTPSRRTTTTHLPGDHQTPPPVTSWDRTQPVPKPSNGPP